MVERVVARELMLRPDPKKSDRNFVGAAAQLEMLPPRLPRPLRSIGA